MDEQLFGEFNTDGSVKREPQICAASGRQIATLTTTTRGRIKGTRFFFRWRAGTVMTPERRAELAAMVQSAPAPVKDKE